MMKKETKGALISLAVAGAIGCYFYSKLAGTGYWSGAEIEKERELEINEKIDDVGYVEVAKVAEEVVANDKEPEIKSNNNVEPKKEEKKNDVVFDQNAKAKQGGKDISELFDKKFADLLATVDGEKGNVDEDDFGDLMDFEDVVVQNDEQQSIDASENDGDDKIDAETVIDIIEPDVIEEEQPKPEVKKSAIQLHLEEIGIGVDDEEDDEFEEIDFEYGSEEHPAVKVIIPLQNVNKKDGVAQIELQSILDLYAIM